MSSIWEKHPVLLTENIFPYVFIALFYVLNPLQTLEKNWFWLSFRMFHLTGDIVVMYMIPIYFSMFWVDLNQMRKVLIQFWYWLLRLLMLICFWYWLLLFIEQTVLYKLLKLVMLICFWYWLLKFIDWTVLYYLITYAGSTILFIFQWTLDIYPSFT